MEEVSDPIEIPDGKIKHPYPDVPAADADIRNLRITTHPVEEGWSEWSQFSECSASCKTEFGSGTKTRTRTCIELNSGNPGLNCGGISSQSRTCNTDTCPGSRKSCSCNNSRVRCRSNCKRGELCELVSWFQAELKIVRCFFAEFSHFVNDVILVNRNFR